MREQNSATTMNRREMLKLSAVAALIGTGAFPFPDMIQATQAVAMKPISLPELPPKSSADVAAKLFPGFVQTEVRTSGATIPVFHKGDGPPVLLLHGYPETPHHLAQSGAEDLPSGSRSTYLISEDTAIRAARRRRSQRQLLVPRNGVGPGRDDCVILATSSSLWVPTIAVLASPIGCVSTFPKRQKGLSHGHRSDVDDVRTNQPRVCDEVHVVVLPDPSGSPARTSHWTRSSVLSGRNT